MARPTKQGIDYFPLDSVFDDEMNLLLADVGAEGLGIVITIWQMIYSGKGYYVENNEMLPLKIKMRCFSDVETIVSVIQKAVFYGIFDRNLEETNNILTSKGVQKRYFSAAKKKKTIEINSGFLLISIDSADNLVFVDDNRVIDSGNTTKEKESKKEEIKRRKIKVKESSPVFTEFVESFYSELSKNGGKQNYSKKEITAGANTIDKLVRLDTYNLEKEIKPALQWGLKDSFWSGQIRSLAQLRTKSKKNGESKFNNLFNRFSAREVGKDGKRYGSSNGSKRSTGYIEAEEVKDWLG